MTWGGLSGGAVVEHAPRPLRRWVLGGRELLRTSRPLARRDYGLTGRATHTKARGAVGFTAERAFSP